MRKAALATGRLCFLVAFVAVVLAMLASSASANRTAASISFYGAGQLVSDPGPVTVTVHYFCLPPSPGNIEIGVDQNGMFFSDFIVGGATCDGKNHSLTDTIFGLYMPGVAVGDATVENQDGSATASVNQQISIQG
jgi:hypothetical protein